MNTNDSPAFALRNWAYLKHIPTTYDKLRNLALNERWYYKSNTPTSPYPILKNYIKYTFYKLSCEEDKIIESGNYAAFNTGLVDDRYEPIYALFEKNDQPDKQKWRLVDFCIMGEGFAGKELVRNFKNTPKRAHYFNTVSDMMYDVKVGAPELDLEHIILENSDRLPVNFLQDNKPNGFEIQNPESMSYDNRKRYSEQLATAIRKDKKNYRNITNRLRDSINLALKRVQWNYRTAIPMYYPTQNMMSLLLPLSLVDDEIVDIALVVEKVTSGKYLGHTILPLNWAYSNARLITRPDSDWLVPEKIDTTPDEDEEEQG